VYTLCSFREAEMPLPVHLRHPAAKRPSIVKFCVCLSQETETFSITSITTHMLCQRVGLELSQWHQYNGLVLQKAKIPSLKTTQNSLRTTSIHKNPLSKDKILCVVCYLYTDHHDCYITPNIFEYVWLPAYIKIPFENLVAIEKSNMPNHVKRLTGGVNHSHYSRGELARKGSAIRGLSINQIHITGTRLYASI